MHYELKASSTISLRLRGKRCPLVSARRHHTHLDVCLYIDASHISDELCCFTAGYYFTASLLYCITCISDVLCYFTAGPEQAGAAACEQKDARRTDGCGEEGTILPILVMQVS